MMSEQQPTPEQLVALERVRADLAHGEEFGNRNIVVRVADLAAVLALFPQPTPSTEATSVAVPTDREVATAANCINVLRHTARAYLIGDIGDFEAAALERVLSFARAHQTEDETWEPV